MSKGPRLRDVDALFSKFVRQRDGECVAHYAEGDWPEGRAGMWAVVCNGNLQAAHVISRRYHGTRYASLNPRALCAAHHLYETHHPLEGHEFWKTFLGEAVFDDLRDRALHHRGHLDLKAIAADLRVKLAEQEERERESQPRN